MAIDFPNSPATNATYTVGNKTWIYDGATWNTYNSTTFSAETLPGTTIKSTVTGSSLTSVGTLASGSIPASLLTGTTLPATIVTSSLTSVSTLGSLTVAGDVTVDTNTLKVDSTNNRIGVGTVSPGYALEVQGAVAARSSATADGVLVYGNGTGSSSRTVSIYPATLTGNQNFILPNATGTAITTGNLTSITNVGTLASGLTVTGTISATAYTSTSANQTTNYIKLGTAAADSEGSLYGYTAYGAIRTTCGYGIGISWISNGGGAGGFTPNAHAVFLASGTVSGDIRSNSNTTVSYNTSSDYRLKENISEITDGIERIRQLRPVKYQFKDPNNDTFYDGFLAHEVQPVAPYAISGEKDAVGENGLPMYQQIDTSWLVGLLAAGIKDLDKRLTELEGLTNGS